MRALMRRCAKGPWDEVWALDLGRDSVPPSLLEGVDTIFHLAGKAHAVLELAGDEEDHQHVTVEGTRRLLAAASEAGAERLIFFSSVKAMGEGGALCQDENTECVPETPYGRAKLKAEGLIREFGARTGAHVVTLRLPLVYGPGSKGNLARMLEAVAAGRFPPLPDTGNKRSMVHVDDVVALAVRACEQPQAATQTYIITDGRCYSTRELFETMCEALGKPVPRLTIPSPMLGALAKIGDFIGSVRGRRFVFDSDTLRKLSESAWYSSAKAERELGFHPRRNLRDALPDMVAELHHAHSM